MKIVKPRTRHPRFKSSSMCSLLKEPTRTTCHCCDFSWIVFRNSSSSPQSPTMASYTREVPLQSGKCALLVIDVQQYFAVPGRGYHANTDPSNIPDHEAYFFRGLATSTIPAIRTLLSAFRSKPGGEVVYTYVESLTKDGRDQSLDYKCTGLLVPRGSPGAKIIDELQPRPDEIMIPKTSSSVFNSTNIEYVLRNLGRS